MGHGFIQTCLKISGTYTLAYVSIKWIWNLLSPYGKRYALYSVLAMLAAMFVAMAISYVLKEMVNAVAAGDRELALLFLYLGVGGALVLSQILMVLHNFTKELSWNSNYKSLFIGFSQLFFNRTMGELNAEDSDVGAEQLESTKEKVNNILYLLLFETSQVVATIVTATILMCVVDWHIALSMFMLICANVLWFLFFNTFIEEKMDAIDKQFRRHHRRTVDKWSVVASVKAAGVENKVLGQIGSEIDAPLAADKKVWAYWFQKVEFIRAICNNVFVVLMIGFGITYANWNAGDIAAMLAWCMVILEKFGYVGHIMRQLTHQIARIKAVREALSTPPAFGYNTGIIYERRN